jgi:hypothetical protein
MAHSPQALRRYLLALKIAASVLVILAYSAVAFLLYIKALDLVLLSYLPFASIGLYGLWKLKKTAFIISCFVLIVTLTALVFADTVGMSSPFLLLLIIYLAELGSSSIVLGSIIGGIKELSDPITAIQTRRAFSRYLINLTGIVTAASLLSLLFCLLGELTGFALGPSYAVMVAIVVLMLGLMRLAAR